MRHLVFFDGECGFCDQAVQWILRKDAESLFAFAPLQGETARQLLQEIPPSYKGVDSLILIENFQTPHKRYYILGQGALRVLWLLGGFWRLIGVFSFLPPFLYNWAYRFVARHRHQLLKKESCLLPNPEQKKRFLP